MAKATDEQRPRQERPVGRSFEDPSRPLGAELIERTVELADEVETGGVRGPGATPRRSRASVSDRARAIAVLRKVDELLHAYNPPPESALAVHRAMELAAGRVGLSLREYDDLVRGDPELVALERQVLGEVIDQFRSRRPTRGARPRS